MSDSRNIRPEHYRINHYPPNLKPTERQNAAPPEKPYPRAQALSSDKIRSSRRKKRYRLLPLLVLGYAIFFITVMLGMLIWSVPAFLTKQDIAAATNLPLVIFLLAIFLSSSLISYIIKARSFLPPFIMTVTVLAFAYFYSGAANIVISGMLLKTLYSLLCAYAAYFLVKITAAKPKRHKKTLADDYYYSK